MELTCIKDVIMDFGYKAFTAGKTYETEEFQKHDGFSTFVSVNDLGKRHLLGRIDDEWVNTHFKIK